jgi:hypothetical protein
LLIEGFPQLPVTAGESGCGGRIYGMARPSGGTG